MPRAQLHHRQSSAHPNKACKMAAKAQPPPRKPPTCTKPRHPSRRTMCTFPCPHPPYLESSQLGSHCIKDNSRTPMGAQNYNCTGESPHHVPYPSNIPRMDPNQHTLIFGRIASEAALSKQSIFNRSQYLKCHHPKPQTPEKTVGITSAPIQLTQQPARKDADAPQYARQQT